MLILGDSIVKYLPPIEGVEVNCRRGATIGQLNHILASGQVSLQHFDYILFHVGTNNVDRGHSVENMCSDYANLVATTKSLNQNIGIIFSAILPRPVDHEITDPIIRSVNKELECSLTKHLGVRFCRSYKPFCYQGKVKRFLFAKLDGGLHLNNLGAQHLRDYFAGFIAHLK